MTGARSIEDSRTFHPVQLRELQRRIEGLQERVQALEDERRPKVIVLREVGRAQAKREVLEYFRTHPGVYPSDVAIALRLESATVRDLCDELIAEGVLER